MMQKESIHQDIILIFEFISNAETSIATFGRQYECTPVAHPGGGKGGNPPPPRPKKGKREEERKKRIKEERKKEGGNKGTQRG